MLNRIKKLLKLNRSLLPFVEKQKILVEGRYGIKYKLIPNSALDAHIIENGIFKDWIAGQDLIKIPKDAVIFDIGANVGLLSLVFAKRYAEKGFVYAYEPDPVVYDQLKENLECNDSIKNLFLNKVALQDNPNIATAQFNIRRAVDGDFNENRGLSSLLNIEQYTVDRIITSVSTLDKEVERLMLKRLDFIKIDVEGFEFNVFMGGENSIKFFKPVILWEFSRVIDKAAGIQNSPKAFSCLTSLGYVHYSISEHAGLKKISSSEELLSDLNIISFYHSSVPVSLVNL